MTAVSTETVLCLRTCSANMTSHGGFRWPGEGETITAPDWDPEPRYGHGLHGLLWGEGDGGLLNWGEGAVWLVFEAEAADVVDLGGKIKVPGATVRKVGARDEVTAWLAERAPGHAIVGLTAAAGDYGTAAAGYGGTAAAGYGGTAAAGDYGTAAAGDYGTAAAGYDGTAAAGYGGTATAGNRGTVMIRRWNGKRYRWTLGEIGETLDAEGNVLEPNVPYRLDADGAFVRAAVPAEVAS